MKARVSITPQMMEKLVKREPLTFRIKPGVTLLEVCLTEDEDAISQFDRVFLKLQKYILDKIEKRLPK
jgi:hypothetical protein